MKSKFILPSWMAWSVLLVVAASGMSLIGPSAATEHEPNSNGERTGTLKRPFDTVRDFDLNLVSGDRLNVTFDTLGTADDVRASLLGPNPVESHDDLVPYLSTDRFQRPMVFRVPFDGPWVMRVELEQRESPLDLSARPFRFTFAIEHMPTPMYVVGKSNWIVAEGSWKTPADVAVYSLQMGPLPSGQPFRSDVHQSIWTREGDESVHREGRIAFTGTEEGGPLSIRISGSQIARADPPGLFAGRYVMREGAYSNGLAERLIYTSTVAGTVDLHLVVFDGPIPDMFRAGTGSDYFLRTISSAEGATVVTAPGLAIAQGISVDVPVEGRLFGAFWTEMGNFGDGFSGNGRVFAPTGQERIPEEFCNCLLMNEVRPGTWRFVLDNVTSAGPRTEWPFLVTFDLPF